jgi:hypothetical protein
LPDHSDVDGSRGHLEPQAAQIISVFRALSSVENPYIPSKAIKGYILENFEIPHHDYWMARTSPREPQRWWKQVYDKAIERLDLTQGLIVRRVSTGKKGLYALREMLREKDGFDLDVPEEFDQFIKCINDG